MKMSPGGKHVLDFMYVRRSRIHLLFAKTACDVILHVAEKVKGMVMWDASQYQRWCKDWCKDWCKEGGQ